MSSVPNRVRNSDRRKRLRFRPNRSDSGSCLRPRVTMQHIVPWGGIGKAAQSFGFRGRPADATSDQPMERRARLTAIEDGAAA